MHHNNKDVNLQAGFSQHLSIMIHKHNNPFWYFLSNWPCVRAHLSIHRRKFNNDCNRIRSLCIALEIALLTPAASGQFLRIVKTLCSRAALQHPVALLHCLLPLSKHIIYLQFLFFRNTFWGIIRFSFKLNSTVKGETLYLKQQQWEK